MESLRIEPPVMYSSLNKFTEDIDICGIKFKAGDPFSIDMLQM
jgi:hypothetical protein